VWPLIDSVEGFLVSPEQERWLFRTARSLPDKANIVEIGSFKGRSTCCLAYGCMNTRKKVFAVDTFDGNSSDFAHRNFLCDFQRNIEERGLGQYVVPIRGLSATIGQFWNKPIHLLFIDGSHAYDDVVADFRNFFPHVVPQGIVAFHDVVDTWPGALKAWRDVASHELCQVGNRSTLAFGRKRPVSRTLDSRI